MEEKMSNVNEYLIPDYVFEDIRQSLRERPNRYGTQTFVSFFRRVFDSTACEETKRWFSEHPRWSPKFVAHFVKQGLHEIVYSHCLVCGKVLTEEQIVEGRQYCSNACQTASDLRKEHARATSIRKYGVDNPIKSQEVLEKRKKNTLQRYGVEHTTQLNSVKLKAMETLRKNYGVDTPMKSTEIREKTVKHFVEKYGVDNPFKNKDIQERARKTMVERYGVDYFSQSEDHRRKVLITTRKKNYDRILASFQHQNIELLTPKEDFLSGCFSLRFRCLSCGKEFDADNTQNAHCPFCSPHFSKKEMELAQYVKELVGKENVVLRDRSIIKPYELDIVIPSKHLAIEFNGSYWHSEVFHDRNYHRLKSQACEERGFRLIHVFEHEWDSKKAIIKQIIAHAVGVSGIKVYARQCTVSPIDSSQYREFLDTNHLNGAVSSSVRLGLFYRNELVAVIGFGKSRFKKGEYELHRFCVKENYSVIGGFSKLLKHSGVKDFVTFVDKTHFTGKSYEKLGFKVIGETEPNYLYIRGDRILSRMACQKHKLPKLLGEGFDPNMSEYENMTMNGWNRIYDCGNLKLQYSVK